VYARRVEVGMLLNNEVAISSGVNGDEQIVREGSPVRVTGGGQ
jgi:hypothetical protein